MKRWFLVLCAVLVVLAAAGCGGNKDKSGTAPSDIPVKWVNAVVQKNDKMLYKLLDKKFDGLEKNEGAKNDAKVKHYKLTQWKKDDDTYFYDIVYKNPVDGQTHEEKMKVIKTDKGWKKAQYLPPDNFKMLVDGLKSKVLREMSE